jgi:maltoporin
LFIAAALAYSAPAAAVDLFGYFRDGFTVNSKGGGATCFKTPGMDYKLRLGNECDNYGEWGLQQSIYKDKNGVEVTAGVMFDYDQPVATPTGTGVTVGIQQNYFKMKMPQWGGAQVWGGKQYYRRENIDMIDFFYLNTSDTGIGVEDVDLGFGKLAVSVFGAAGSQVAHGMVFIRPDVRVYGIPVNPGGTLEVDLNVTTISRNTDLEAGGVAKGDNDASAGFWVTVEHVQKGILGGMNTLALQYATANAANMGGATPGFTLNSGTGATDKAQQASDAINKNNWQFRALDQLLLQPSAQIQVLVGGVYQMKQWGTTGVPGDTTKIKATQYGIFARPKYWFTEYFNLQGDIGFTSNKVEHVDAINLFKLTVAPTLSPAVGEAGGFFVRPEFRLFLTYASWNDATNKVSATGASSDVSFGVDKKAGLTYGAQVEGWF